MSDDLTDVTQDEFEVFLVAYPRPLERNVIRFCEPPNVNYNDFARAPKWPESVVASFMAYDEGPRGFRVLAKP